MQKSDTTKFQDRRVTKTDRRIEKYRRSAMERRCDYRKEPKGQRKSILLWLKSKRNARLGVDRRKADRRKSPDRRQQRYLEGILSKEEIADLLESIETEE